MKKGILFTLTVVLIASLVLTIATLNFKNIQKSKDRLAEIGSLDRVSSITNSISNGFNKLFYVYSKINVTLSNQTITFEEYLPNNNASIFKSNLDLYKNYIEREDSNLILNINTLKSEMPLVILPYNITYKHNSYGGNKILIIPEEVNFNKYYLEIQNISIASCTWNTYAGNFTFQLYTNNVLCDNTRSIDLTKNNSININSGGILIYINDTLTVQNNGAAIKLKTSITLDNIENERITVKSYNNIINLNYISLNLSRSSGFRII